MVLKFVLCQAEGKDQRLGDGERVTSQSESYRAANTEFR